MAFTRRQFIQGLSASAVILAAPRVVVANTLALRGLPNDGTVNALPAIEALIREAERRGRGEIQIPAGRFLLIPENRRSAIILPANVSLRGAGRDETTLVMGPDIVGHMVSATFGYANISDLTIDGNEAQREGRIGHGLRIGGHDVSIERVRVANSPSYGIAISQRNYARNVTIRDVLIENAGADGIDIKNRMHQTSGILIENVVVTGFGRPLRSLDKSRIGTPADIRGDKAAVDLRGQCEVRNLTVNGILPDRDGLRFRPGEGLEKKNLGAHGSKASNVIIRADPNVPAVVGIAVAARDIEISDVQIEGASTGIRVFASNLKLRRGVVRNSRYALSAVESRLGSPSGLSVADMAFENSGFRVASTEPAASFQNCRFIGCRTPARDVLEQAGARIESASFDSSCAASTRPK